MTRPQFVPSTQLEQEGNTNGNAKKSKKCQLPIDAN
jgi:hypothetical protein